MNNRFMTSCLLAFLFVLGGVFVASAAEPATLVFKNGVVYTVDKNRSVAEAVAVRGEKIVFVGDNHGVQAYIDAETKIVDLNGRLLLPGFMDGHHHVAAAQKNKLYEITLGEGTSVDDYAKSIRAFAADPKNADLKIAHGFGWINDVFAEYNKSRYGENTVNLGPKAGTLDEILAGTPLENMPVTINSSDGHSTWANTKALEIAKLLDDTDTPDPQGGKIERDPVTKKAWGTFRDEGGVLLTKRLPPIHYTRDQYVAALEHFERELHSYGITGVFGPGSCTHGILNPGEGELYEALKFLEQKNELGLIYRLCSYADIERSVEENIGRAMALRERHAKNRLLRFDAIKIFADGVIEDRSGYLLEPYADNTPETADYRGRRIRDPEAARELVTAADARGFQVHVHAIGDAACREYVDAFEAAAKINGVRDSRHTITHLQLVADSDLGRMAKLGIIASVQPYWFGKEPLFFNAECRMLGTERANREYPMRKLFECGLVVAGSSDAPVTDLPYPLAAIETGVTRCAPGTLPTDRDVLGPDERVKRTQMIECFTINVAKQLFVEEMVGSIEPGKLANLVILERNILDEKAVPDWEIAKTPVAATYFLGVKVYDGSAGRESAKRRSENTPDAVPQDKSVTEANPSDESRERDGIFMLLAYAVVFKDWQTQNKLNPRGYNVGAVLVDSRTNIPVAWERNCIASTKNPTQHAEVRLIQSSIESQIPDSSGNVYLDHFTVYTTLEPCAMCAGMICLTKIPRVIYGQSDDDKNGRAGYGKAVERLKSESSGFKPYPRTPKTSEKSGDEFGRRLDVIFMQSLEPSITTVLTFPETEQVYRDAWSAFHNYVPRYESNKPVLKDARKFLQNVNGPPLVSRPQAGVQEKTMPPSAVGQPL